MYLNDKYFSFPPYISTSWEHVVSINYKEDELFVSLVNGNVVVIEGLEDAEIDSIFKAHATYLEKEALRKQPGKIEQPKFQPNVAGGEIFKLGFGATDGYGMMLQHNPAQANAPELPKEILHKISSIAKILAPEDVSLLPSAEPNCNCFHCQIAKAIEASFAPQIKEELEIEEKVSEEDLKFQQWEIVQTGDKLFSVKNKLDPKEVYSVYLGQPIGCTCGKEGCEHILVVLKS